MNGDRYLVDTNAIVSLLQGDTKLAHLLENADWVGISVISQVEFLAFSGLSHLDRQLFQTFLQRVEVIDLTSTDTELIEKIIEMRQRFRLKLRGSLSFSSTRLQRVDEKRVCDLSRSLTLYMLV